MVPNFDAEIMNKDWGNELRCVYTLPSLLKVISIAPSLQRSNPLRCAKVKQSGAYVWW